ncbi:GNAT family N-acetyltransferase [Streptococcus sinensis]|uniref:GNAT family N-acetyltransferase n=1 Tax=Streptococcus sinensis TaxID=176090 RepID=UPI001FD030EC|nr:GNAT family N-acetyltransferase [Streptococcus sinensis]MCY7218015.1 GNAT family N-acetyltransferase [Streptococcus cristatus]
MVLLIRKASEEDWQIIQDICTETWLSTYQEIYSSQYIRRVFEIFYSQERLVKDLTELSPEWNGYWLAEVDGQALGCIGGGMGEDGRANIYVLYVLPRAQRLGVGHALVRTLTDYQKSEHQAVEQAVTVTEGNTLGISFYEKEGFGFENATKNWIDSSQARDLHYFRNI